MLSILGLVAIIVLTYQVYKNAAGTERNAIGWAALTLLVGVGIQFVIPLVVGVTYGIYLASSEATYNDAGYSSYVGLMSILGLGGVVFSILGMWLIAKHVSKVKDNAEIGPAPPPPPAFGLDGQS